MKWQIWKTSKQTYLGLDISHTAIKLVYLVSEASQLFVPNALQAEISEHSKETAGHAITQTIKQLICKIPTTCRGVVTALSDSDCLSQLIQLNQKSSNWKIDALITAAPSVPLPLDTLYFDFQKLKDSDSHERILGVFCRKELVHERMQLVENSGLKLITLEVKSHALERSFRYLYDLQRYPKCWTCIEVNKSSLTLLLWSHHTVLGSFSDSLEDPTSLLAITVQLHQHLTQLLSTYTTSKLEGLWVVGDHMLCTLIQEKIRQLLGLGEHPSILKRQPETKLPTINWNPFYVAFGLALRHLS